MMKPSNTYKTFDIIVVPFPFVDSLETKKRPAIILSNAGEFNDIIGHSIVAMITSASHSLWPLDILINNLSTCGLIKSSIIRLKLFIIDHRFILNKIGTLAAKDQKKLRTNFSLVFNNLKKL